MLAATVRDAAGRKVPDQAFTWVSSASNIATVSDVGIVTAITDGTTTITATANGIAGTATATVHQVAAKLAFVIQPS